MKKAYIVCFEKITRVVVEEIATKDEIIKAARAKLVEDGYQEHTIGDELTYIAEDLEYPYDPDIDGV